MNLFLPKSGKPVFRGITIIELLFTISLIATLGVMSTAYYARFLNQNALTNSTDQLVNTLRKAQFYSMIGKQGSSWGVNRTGQTVTLFKGSALGENPQFNETFSISSTVTISGLTSITFARLTGKPSSTTLITLSGNNATKSISLNSQGVVSRN